ncbi:hypothetical protein [uncultured Thiothrix sp.]|uniref:hypothetical protein n=1 Tax=uncultured Thiothrix sp. TaxID=223185 RepID=UPI00260B1BC6|nr:hypothetical protein [uncultured Thiothrix sp.]HMT92877.1 hypothetical protein [Thiolinea sp.]
MLLRFLYLTSLALSLSYAPLSMAEAPLTPIQLFVGKNQTLGTQLWQTDNTPEQTKVFSYLSKTPNADSSFYPLGSVGNYGIFAAFTPEAGQELWRTDGSAAGTQLIKDLAPGQASGLAKMRELYTQTSINLKERLLFWGQTADQLTLYSTDGSSENTQALAQFPRSSDQSLNIASPIFYGLSNTAFFWVNDGIHGLELWKTDGSAAGTQLVVDASKEANDYNNLLAYVLEPLNNQSKLFFIAADQRSNSTEEKIDYSLWQVDGNNSERLTRFPKQTALSFTTVAANENKVIWVKTNDTDQQPELWQFDLKTKQASLILHLPAAEQGARSINASKALFFKGKLYVWFSVLGEQILEELWVTDFTAKGTERLVSLPNPNNEYQAPPLLFSFAKRLYFMQSDGIRPSALWLTDGTVTGTKNILSMKDGQYAGGAGDSWPARPTPYVLRTDKLIFPTFSPKDRNRSQLWSLTPEQPEKPLLLGEFDDPQLLPPAPNDQASLVYFLSGKQRWHTDGTVAGTKALGNDPIRAYWEPTHWPSGGLSEILPLAGKQTGWILAETDLQAGKEPWLLSSEISQSKVLKDINTTPASADLRQVQPLGSTWYFVLNSRLWATKLDPNTTRELTSLPKEEHISFNAQSLIKFKDTLYFLTETAEKINSLWQLKDGQLQRLRTFPTGYSWLFPSSQGVYAAYFPPETAGAWTLELWQTEAQKFLPVLKETEDKRRLATLLETEQGLLYVLEPKLTLNGARTAYSLNLQTKEGTSLVLNDSFEPVPNVLNNTLFTTANTTYLLTQKENDLLNYQLSRIDWATKQVMEVDTPALPQQSSLLAASKGLFILSQAPQASFWWLADENEEARLIKTFAAKEYVDLVKVVDEKLYFQLMRLTQDEPPRELWITNNTGGGMQKLADDLEMLRD